MKLPQLGRQRFRQQGREFALVFAILAVAVVMALGAPGFFRFGNQRDLLMANMPVAMVVLGMTLVILTGQIDISVGSQFAICSVTAGLLAKAGLPTPAAALGTCLAGALLGALNGALVAYVRIPSIVVTLATMVALRDGLRWATQGAWVQDLPPGFQWFGQSQGASEAITLAAVVVLIAAFAWGLRYLAAGRAFYAAGSNPEAARLAGIDPARVVFAAFTITGALTGLAALSNAVRFNQIPSNAGLGLELQAIAAVIVGGVAVTGGQGTLAGALAGVILLGMIGPALTFLGISAYWERAIQGAIILAAVALDRSKAAGRAAGPPPGPAAPRAGPAVHPAAAPGAAPAPGPTATLATGLSACNAAGRATEPAGGNAASPTAATGGVPGAGPTAILATALRAGAAAGRATESAGGNAAGLTSATGAGPIAFLAAGLGVGNAANQTTAGSAGGTVIGSAGPRDQMWRRLSACSVGIRADAHSPSPHKRRVETRRGTQECVGHNPSEGHATQRA
ncbi:MAG: ABC transporter permease [Bryobacteraceae bacterium]